MRALFFFLFLGFCASSLTCLARDEENINLHSKGNLHSHFVLPVPAVEPDVYYDADNQEIIIVGTGNLSYYDMEIESLTTWNVLISTQVDGIYDTIDISSLPSDNYVITIDTSVGVSFEGYFTIY